jgi:hypothetical protein
LDEDIDPRIKQMQDAWINLAVAADHMAEATVNMKGIINTNTWKRMDNMLGDLQKLEYDTKEWMIRNGIE